MEWNEQTWLSGQFGTLYLQTNSREKYFNPENGLNEVTFFISKKNIF